MTAKAVEHVTAAYRLKLGELQRVTSEGELQAIRAVKSVQHNAEAIEAREQGARLQAEVLTFARGAVPELAKVHFAAGHTKCSAIAEQIRAEFVDVALRALPGASLYVSLRGFGQNPSSLRMRADAQARFSVYRSALRAEVEDIVIRMSAENPPKTRRQRLDDWWKKSPWGGVAAALGWLIAFGLGVDNCRQRIGDRIKTAPPGAGTNSRGNPRPTGGTVAGAAHSNRADGTK